MTNGQVIGAYWEAFKAQDFESMEAFLSPDLIVSYPQSGELMRGPENFMATVTAYPIDVPQVASAGHLAADEKLTTTLSPGVFGFRPTIVTNHGDLLVGWAELAYPDGSLYHVCTVFRMRALRIVEMTSFFAAPFDPPQWRSQWVEVPSHDDTSMLRTETTASLAP